MLDWQWLDRSTNSWLIFYLSSVGALSAVVACGLMLAGHYLFGITKPTGLTFLFAALRGAIYALLLGFGIRAWRRQLSVNDASIKRSEVKSRGDV